MDVSTTMYMQSNLIIVQSRLKLLDILYIYWGVLCCILFNIADAKRVAQDRLTMRRYDQNERGGGGGVAPTIAHTHAHTHRESLKYSFCQLISILNRVLGSF